MRELLRHPMFAIGLGLKGRIFPFEVGQPLVMLAAFADVGVGLVYLVAKAAGLGARSVDHLEVTGPEAELFDGLALAVHPGFEELVTHASRRGP